MNQWSICFFNNRLVIQDHTIPYNTILDLANGMQGTLINSGVVSGLSVKEGGDVIIKHAKQGPNMVYSIVSWAAMFLWRGIASQRFALREFIYFAGLALSFW